MFDYPLSIIVFDESERKMDDHNQRYGIDSDSVVIHLFRIQIVPELVQIESDSVVIHLLRIQIDPELVVTDCCGSKLAGFCVADSKLDRHSL